MKRISVRELKAHWSRIEKQVRDGETFEVLNHGRPAALIVPPQPRPVAAWDDHLATAVQPRGVPSEQLVELDRGGRC